MKHNTGLKWVNSFIQKQSFRGVLVKRCSGNMQQVYRKHPCGSVISIKFLCNFIEISLRHGCSPVNLLHIFRTSFPKDTSRGLLLFILLSNKLTTCVINYVQVILNLFFSKSKLISVLGNLYRNILLEFIISSNKSRLFVQCKLWCRNIYSNQTKVKWKCLRWLLLLLVHR